MAVTPESSVQNPSMRLNRQSESILIFPGSEEEVLRRYLRRMPKNSLQHRHGIFALATVELGRALGSTNPLKVLNHEKV
jgi:hypothetical protein